ncbi:MAG: dihydrofolate reductase [Ferruginibacter sp.]
MIALIVAASTNNAIGLNNELLWHLPNDLKFFKNTTWGFPVIMGRKTFEAVNKTLPGRVNIVITRNQDWSAPNVVVAHDIFDAITKAKLENTHPIFIIGGGEVYRQSMPIADRIYMTRVHADLLGDAYFPEIDTTQWELVAEENFPADEKHAYAYAFQTWDKIK